MPTLLADPSFKLYVLCCAVLSLEMLVLAAMTAAKRSGRKNYLNPEDVKVSFKDAKLIDGAEHPDVARVQRAHRNLNESLPMFFALGLVSVLVSASPLGVKVCLGAFTVPEGTECLHLEPTRQEAPTTMRVVAPVLDGGGGAAAVEWE